MDDSELLKIFWTEVRDYLERMNNLILALEMSLDDDDAGGFVERLRELNRLAHSMKGAARSVGEEGVEQLGHHMEEILDASLTRGLALTPGVCDLLYDALDLVTGRAEGHEIPAEQLERVTREMTQLVEENAIDDAEVLHLPPEDMSPPTQTNGNRDPRHTSDEFPVVRLENNDEGTDDPPPSASQPATNDDEDTEPTRPTNAPDPPVPPQPNPNASRTQAMTTLMRTVEDSTVRVAVEKLDKLMAESSELLVTRLQSEDRRTSINKLRRHYTQWAREWRKVRAAYVRLSRRLQHEEVSDDLRILLDFLETNQKYLSATARRVNALSTAVANDNMQLTTLTDEIQNSISAMRLVPFETIIGSLQRSLRDAARQTGKEVYLDVVGGNTEIDKTVLEQLKDPIMHLIRNAVDHGIEDTATRVKAGKAPSGWVFLTIETRGSEIQIHVGDDGRGVDPDGVRMAAVERGLLTAAAAANLTDDEARTLIFHPGLTTRSRVTAISGRGVGMDVVLTRVEGLRGRVGLASESGKGTTFTLSVPVSLTRIRSVLLQLGPEQYAIPALSVQRMVRLPRDTAYTVEGRSVVNIGEQTLPLVSLGEMLRAPISSRQPQREDLTVVVLSAGDRQVAFEVDDLLSERELVLKPLGTELENTRYVSGAALLGSGEVVIVLDANDLVRGAFGGAANLPTVTSGRDITTRTSTSTMAQVRRIRVLIADDSITTRTLEKNILETAGYDVRVAYDGVQAWDLLIEHEFDVVVSDVEMPRMDGLDLTRHIKSHPATKDIPVILLTSLQKPEHRNAGLNAGADAYLVKSKFDQGDLLRTIQSVV